MSLTSLLAQGGGFLMKFINAVEILIIKDQYPRCLTERGFYQFPSAKGVIRNKKAMRNIC